MKFYLGITDRTWLAEVDVPVLISLSIVKDDTPATSAEWALDSGGYNELTQHGKWRTTPEEFVERVRGAIERVGTPDFVGAQDWVCGPPALAATGKQVAEHQALTVENLLALRELAPEVPWLPTLQGWAMEDYDRHVSMYDHAGVGLRAEPLVGVGSIATRSHDPETGRVLRHLAGACGLRIHGFGVKNAGLRMYGDVLAAADSSSWSIDARYLRGPNGVRPVRGLPECEAEYKAGEHPATCAGCLRYALAWRERIVQLIPAAQDGLFAPDDTYRGEPRVPLSSRQDLKRLDEAPEQTTMEVE